MELTAVDLTQVQELVNEIDSYVVKLNDEINNEALWELEFSIYRLANALRGLKLVLNNNMRLLSIEKDRLFTQVRPQKTSDLATTKHINNLLRRPITDVELQEKLIDWINEKLRSARRYADHANSMRIGLLADAKRAW